MSIANRDVTLSVVFRLDDSDDWHEWTTGHRTASEALVSAEALVKFPPVPEVRFDRITRTTERLSLHDLAAEAEPAVSAVVAPPTSRAAWLTEAAEIAESLRQFEPAFGARKSAQVSENVGILRVADHFRRLAGEAHGRTQQQPDTEAPRWVGATELAPEHEITALAATGLVGYRQNAGRLLHCLAHKPAPASRYADFHEITADDLDDGGICVHPDCGRDLLSPWPAAPAEQQPAAEACTAPPCPHPADCVHGCQSAADELARHGQEMGAEQQAAAATGYGDGKGRTYCLACASTVGADVPLTADEVDHWELCPSCGRHVVDVAREREQQAAADGDEETPARPECANCWREIENRAEPNMGGPFRDHWVHIPGGFTACFPQRGADSPRAEPRP